MEYENLKWLTESTYEKIEDGIRIYAPANTDYFVNPVNGEVTADAPFLYEEITGDFVLRARVHHEFLSTFDACVLLALDNEKLWAKACFEYTDFGTNAVVTVMTNGKSDDANSVDISGKEVWLQLARKDDIFAVHYSLDGKEYRMARLTHLPMSKTIKVGFEAQSPSGNGGMRYFRDIKFVNKSLDDIRDGNM